MKALIARLTAAGAAVLVSLAAMGQDDFLRFSGQDSATTADFRTDGPWLLDWSIRSEHPRVTNFELRLYDADTGEFAGTIAQLEGTGQGLKLFEEPGNYRIQVVSQNLEWSLQILEVGTEQAARLERATKGDLTFEDRLRKEARRIPKGTVASWRAESDATLLLFEADESRGFRVEFSPNCPGLDDAAAISFVTAPDSGLERYDSILLDDGTRCYFTRVMPTRFE